jgi:hypothetical protein
LLLDSNHDIMTLSSIRQSSVFHHRCLSQQIAEVGAEKLGFGAGEVSQKVLEAETGDAAQEAKTGDVSQEESA